MDALASLSNGSLTGKREQTVLTGDPILDLLGSFWGRTYLDPCAPPVGPIWVECSPCKGSGVKKGKTCRACKGVGGSIQEYTLEPEHAVRLPQDGLSVVWGDRTFVNPPYDDLAKWLLYQHVAENARVIWYVPNRSHRRWWREWRRGLSALIGLNPQKFKGHTQTFPAPLVLGFRGPELEGVRLAKLCKDLDLGESI